MGSGNSKQEVHPQLLRGGSMNILITKDVTDRWEAAMAQNRNPKQQMETRNPFAFEIGAGDGDKQNHSDNLNLDRLDDAATACKENSENQQSVSNSAVGLGSDIVKLSNSPIDSVKNLESVIDKEEDEIFHHHQKFPFLKNLNIAEEDNIPFPEPDIGAVSTSTAPKVIEKIKFSDDKAATLDKRERKGRSDMERILAHFRVHTDAMKRENDQDVEIGNSEDLPHDYVTDVVYLPVQKRSPPSQDFQEYEEVNEKEKENSSKSNLPPPPPPNLFYDEEATFENAFRAKSGAGLNGKTHEMRIPKSALPIIIDQDENGRPTYETLATWKVRDQANKQMERNNQYWTQQLDRITSKVEDQTRKEAQDFQRRLQQISENHPEVYSTSYLPGSHCNMLSAQISRCYEQNPGHVLKCSGLVRQFATCANNVMLNQYGNKVPPN